eukprot:TRINITY_DN25206_c0_g1_i1.p1 TRINITY_DN25206_c0_g1~~TRINITY_DN25206_c0_g1_i1.p1  ORF type:complete len:704 (+),score=226.81 TRINITY_DN25206_c0_g1_i1:85-2196(+)
MDKALVKKATSDSSEPTMGHLYRDIAQMTFTDGKVAQKLVDFLMERLKAGEKKKNGVHQMIKVLKVMKHCASQGHIDFQKGLQKNCDHLREYANYRGAPDPVYGQSLNEQIKAAAREAIDACFREQVQSQVANTLQGIAGGSVDKKQKDTDGFDTFGSGGIGTNAVGGGANRFQEEWNKAHGVGDAGKSTLSKLTGAVANMAGYGAAGAPMPIDGGHAAMMAQAQPNPAGGGYSGIALSAPPSQMMTGAPSQPFKFLQDQGSAAATIAVNDANVALNEAQEVVDKAVSLPSIGRADASRFLKAVGELQEQDLGDDVNARLDEKLAQRVPWQARLNALTLVEALVKAGNDEVKEYFAENPEDIYKNVTVVQSSVKDKAKKTLAALGLPLTRSAAKPAKPPPTLEKTPEQVALASAQQVQDDTRGGRRKKATGGITRKRDARRTSTEITPEQSAGLFAALNTAPAAPSPPAAEPAAVHPQASSLFSFTNAAASAPEAAAAPAPSAGASAFGFMQPGAAPAPVAAAPAAAAPASAFGFMGGAAAAEPEAVTAPVVAQPQPAAPAAPAPAQPSGMNLDDIFGAPAAPCVKLPVVSTPQDPLGLGAPGQPSPAMPKPFDPFNFDAPAQPQAAPQPAAAPPAGGSMMDFFGAPTPAVPTPAVPAPAVPAPPKPLTAAEIAAIQDPAERMRVIQEQQALLAAQIAAMQAK